MNPRARSGVLLFKMSFRKPVLRFLLYSFFVCQLEMKATLKPYWLSGLEMETILMAKISKKQRSTLREIDKLSGDRKRHRIWGFGAIGVMVVLIAVYNLLVYQMGILDEGNVVIRAMLYITAMVAAGVSGINLMKASREQRKIDGYRQAVGISKDTLDAWKRGDIE